MRINKLSFLLILCVLPSLGKAQESLTLQKAVELGLQNNYSLRIARNNAEIAGNNNTIGNAGFLPSLDATLTQNNTISNSKQEFYSGDIRERNNAESHSLNAGVTLSIPLFDGLRMFVTKDQLALFESVGQYQMLDEMANTVAAIIGNYFSVVEMEKLMVTEQKTMVLSRERKRIAEEKLKIGSGSKASLLQATVDLNTDSATLISQMTNLSVLKSSLNQLLARDPEFDFIAVDDVDFLSGLTYEYLVDRLKEQNPGLIISRFQNEIAQLDIKAVKSEMMPNIGAFGGYNYSKLNAQTGLLKSSFSSGPSYGITASINLFNGLNTQRKLQNARLNFASQETLLTEAELSARTGLYQAWVRYNGNLNLIALENTNVEVARQNLEFALEKYRLGAISDLELRDIQLKLTGAESRLITARFLTKVSETELLRLSGLLLKK